MAEGMPHSELVRRALEWILACRAEADALNENAPPLGKLLDEAGMRFNLTPMDSEALRNLLSSGK